ncbi:MAG: BatA domain-containing protein [Planctomycetes bacterium]|nr:BatA domain-containing protein [Planctomycetota bacterium]
MTFLNPTLAAVALGCVMIPIIIHILMRRRRRPVPWGAMKFLLEAYKRQRRRMNLEQLLLLASRCLLVVLLALAVGKPVLGAAGLLAGGGSKTLYLLIDNSVTSGLGADVAGDGAAIEAHKKAALDLIATLDRSRGDRVGVILMGAPVDAAILPASSELSAAVDLVKNLKPVDSRADLPGAFAKLRDELGRKENEADSGVWVAALSDFRTGSADPETTVPSLGLAPGRVTFLASAPAAAPAENISITAVEPLRGMLLAANDGAESATTVRVSLRRSGAATPASTKVTLSASYAGETSRTESLATATWNPGQETAQVFANLASPKGGATKIGVPLVITATIDRDALSADNRFVRPVETRERLEVALIAPGTVGVRGALAQYSSADWLALALSPQADLTLRRRQVGELRVQTIDPAQGIAPSSGVERVSRGAGVLKGMDAVVVPRPDLLDAPAWAALREAVGDGALIVLCPPVGIDAHVWTDAMNASLGLSWQVAREARTLTPPGTIAPLKADAHPMLEVIAAELPTLVKGVTVSKLLDVRAPSGAFEAVLTLMDGSPLIVAGQPGSSENAESAQSAARGTVVLFAAPPDLSWTDLPARPLMVPLMQEIVRQGVGRSLGPRVAPAGASPTLPRGASELVRVGEEGGLSTVAVTAMGLPANPIRDAGLWTVRAAGGNTLGALAFNADPAGGAVEVHTRDEISKWLGPVSSSMDWITSGANAVPAGGSLNRKQDAPPVSVPLLIAAGFIAVVELILARIFSHANRDGFAAASPPTQTVRKEAA